MIAIDLAELVRWGYLLDLNRRWAHPLGLEVGFKGGVLQVSDLRHLPGGAFFGDQIPGNAAAKAAMTDAERSWRAGWRRENLGAVVEPVEGYQEPAAALAGLAPGGWTALGDWAADVGAELGLDAAAVVDPDHADWLAARAAELVLSRLSALFGGAGIDGAGRLTLGAAPKQERGPDAGSRLRYLLSEVPDLQERHGQLYPEEIAEVERIAADPGDVEVSVKAMERLHGLAQAGMRFFRGDKAARTEFDTVRQVVGAQVARVMATRSEVARYVEGEIAPDVVQDRPGILAELARQIAALEPRAADASADLRRVQLEAQDAEGRLALLRTARGRLAAADAAAADVG